MVFLIAYVSVSASFILWFLLFTYVLQPRTKDRAKDKDVGGYKRLTYELAEAGGGVCLSRGPGTGGVHA